MADTESDTATGEQRSFWNWRVYAVAGVLALTQVPSILSYPTAAGAFGGVLGAIIGSLAVVGVLKGLFIVAKRGLAAVSSQITARL